MIPIKFTTGTATPVWTLASTYSSFWGCVATNAESATYFIKLYWSKSNAAPIVGTTVPTLTVPVSTTFVGLALYRALTQNAPLYYTVTKNAADTDATALSNGGDVITLFVE